MSIFDTLTNLTKSAVALAAAPVVLVADIVTLPASSMDPHRGPFDRTADMLDKAGRALDAAVEPERSK